MADTTREMAGVVDGGMPANSDSASPVQVLAMTEMLFSIPRVEGVDAIAVQPGLGENWRVTQAVDRWNNSPQARNLFVTGVNPNERTYTQHRLSALMEPPFNLTRFHGVETQIEARHIPDQAAWLAEQMKQHGTTSMELHVSPYHLLRAFCATLKAHLKTAIPRVPIIPVAVRVSPDTVIPETGRNAWDMVPAESARVPLYQGEGDVATYDEFRDYLGWLWRQPMLNNGRPAPYHRQLLHDVVSELQALRDNEFVPEADIDTVWVFSGHGTYDQEGDLKPYEGVSFDRLNFDAGVQAVREITAKRLGLHVDLITKEDIEEHGPTLFYNGADAETPNVHYIQNEAVIKAMEDPDFPLPISKVVIGRIADNNTPAQMEGFGLYAQNQIADGRPAPQKIAVVSSFAHRARIGRYLERFKYTFPEGTKFVNGPMPREPEHVNRMAVAMKEARAVLYYYDAGHLALRSALVPRPEGVTEVPRNLLTRLKSVIAQGRTALRGVTSRVRFGTN